MADLGLLPPPPPRAGSRALAVALAVVVTVGLLAIALRWGSWAYDTRADSLHRKRLARLVEQKPNADLAARALRDEGMSPIAPPTQDEVLAKSRQWARTQAFATDGYVYVLYFDGEGILKDFTYAARR